MQIIRNFVERFWRKERYNIAPGKRELWWIDNKIGGYDGYELGPGGKLFLLNWDLFTGIRWEMNTDGFYTEMVYKKNGTVLKKTAAVLSLTDQEMVLKTVANNTGIIDKYIKIAYGMPVDKFYGHYISGQSYVQIIPVHEHQFQIVFSEHDKADVVKYFGHFDEKTKTLEFKRENDTILLNLQIKGETEELTVADKRYYRPTVNMLTGKQ